MTRGKVAAALHPIGPDEYRLMVAAQMTEAALQERTIGLARTYGWRHYHAPDNRPGARGRVQSVVAGWPDLVLVHPAQARILYRELKRAKGIVSPEQIEWLELLRIAGADAGVWRPIDLLDGTIERTLAPRREH